MAGGGLQSDVEVEWSVYRRTSYIKCLLYSHLSAEAANDMIGHQSMVVTRHLLSGALLQS